MTILQIYCVQRIGPANPHWAIYYIKAIVHKSLCMLKMRFLNHKCSYAIGRQMYQ